MNFLISYDISDDRLRDRLAKLLKREGCMRIQKSVFIAPDYPTKHLLILRGKVLTLTKGQLQMGESIICIPIEGDNTPNVLWTGAIEGWDDLNKKIWVKVM